MTSEDTPILRWLVANGKGGAIYGPHPDADPLKVSQLVTDWGLVPFGPDMWIDPAAWEN